MRKAYRELAFRMYRVFDCTLDCELPLMGLPSANSGRSAIKIVTREDAHPEISDFKLVQEWRGTGGELLIASHRREEFYLLVFPEKATFLIDLDKRQVDVFPSDGISTATLSHLITDQVIPRCLGQAGEFIVHASAVGLKSGSAIAFVGDSGTGKSTLASSFFQTGATLVTDDCLKIELQDSGLRAVASYPGIRLWPDSAQQIFSDSSGLATVTHYTNKEQYMLATHERVSNGWIPLEAVFILDRNFDGRSPLEISLEPLKGGAAVMALVEAGFVLDPACKQAVPHYFENIVRLVESGVPFYRLRFPHVFDQLPSVQRRVRDVLRR